MKHILIIDDDAAARASMRTLFETEYHVTLTSSADDGMNALEQNAIDLVLMDVVMPDNDGLILLQEVVHLYPELPVIMVSATDRARPVVDSMRVGAVDFVTKPFDVRELRALVQRTLERQRIRRKSMALETEVSRLYPTEDFIGESKGFQDAIRGAKWAARTDVRVLIHGTTGTGKEMLARHIHAWSNRKEEPFVVARCTGSNPESIAARIFGDADADVPERISGKIGLAGSGTLYLKDIDALPPSLQERCVQLLRQGSYSRQGGSRTLHSSVRIVASCSQQLEENVNAGVFNRELFELLNVAPLKLDPLKKRREDIPSLITFFLSQFRQSMDTAANSLDSEAEVALVNYDWPGNIRELRLVLERVVLLHLDKEILERTDLPPEFQPPLRAQTAIRPAKKNIPSAGLSDSIQSVERELLVQALRDAKGVQTKAAKQLGVTRRILKYKMDKLNITLPLPEE